MSDRLILFYKNENEPDESKWAKQIRKIFKYLALMEKNKYLPPKYSDSIKTLSNFLKDHLVRKLL